MSSPLTDFAPFRNDKQVLVLSDGEDELMLENGSYELVLHGQLRLRRDEAGAQALEQLLVVLRRAQREIARQG